MFGGFSASNGARRGGRKKAKRVMSAQARVRIAAAQRKRWAKQNKAAKNKVPSAVLLNCRGLIGLRSERVPLPVESGERRLG